MVAEHVEDGLSEDFNKKKRSKGHSKKKSPRVYAMDHLCRREMSFHELVARMMVAKYPEEQAYEAVSQLRSENLQNDERFVEAYVLSKIQRGHGPNKIRYDIKAKQVGEHLVNRILMNYEDQWSEIAITALQKHYHPSELKDLTIKQKAFQYLLRKGHDTAMIYEAFKAMLA